MPVNLGTNGITTYESLAAFYCEVNPLTKQKRYNHITKERAMYWMKEIIDHSKSPKHLEMAEIALQELSQN